MLKRSCLIISILVIALFLVACSGGANSKLQEQLDLGQKYLAEADFENALIAFETAIEIDDKCVEAYIGAAEAYIGLGEPQKALEILNIGLEKTGDKQISQRAEGLKNSSELPKEEEGNLEKLVDISKQWDIDNLEAFLETDEFRSLLHWMENSGLDMYLFGDNPNKIGFYRIDDKIMMYVGDYSGDLRSGNGIWFSHGYYAIGQWENDKPKGSQTLEYRHNGDSWTATGNMNDGLWDGEVVFTINGNGQSESFLESFDNGVFNVYEIREGEYGYKIGLPLGDTISEGHYMTKEQVERIRGLLGFAEFGYI